jgi:hypothetical protein
MRTGLAFAALVTALAAVVPSVTSAAVLVNISALTPVPNGNDTVYMFEAWAQDPDGIDERLDAFTIAIDGPRFTDDGVRFVDPGPVLGDAGIPMAHPYVFKDLVPLPPVESFNSTFNRLQLAAAGVQRDDEANIDEAHSGLVRFSVLFPADAPPGAYPIVVDGRSLSLAGLGAPINSAPGAAGGFVLVPEPSGAALLLVPPLALLRRRRREQPVRL